ncbi:hypothetical protein SAMN05421847_0472 [Halpernia humi]|uniref:Uncharacterized protein n=1 Tax=Halpernia humi TaxID=493375 RepID=A0A1H5TGZ0_9FLAO|nr:hypothetical protein [Halpernia humi]SEF62079.1 hypothetical protein SAMN05421847_0472 [Halpernia humi]
MPNNKVNYKSIFLQSFLGVIGYFIFQSFNKKSVLSLGIGSADFTDYQPKYFTKQEYFKNFDIAAAYLKNWYGLSRIMDKIRIAFGSPVLISRGYEKPTNENLNDYNQCLAVDLTPQNKDVVKFKNTVQSLIDSNQIQLSEFIPLTNNNFKITVNL